MEPQKKKKHIKQNILLKGRHLYGLKKNNKRKYRQTNDAANKYKKIVMITRRSFEISSMDLF